MSCDIYFMIWAFENPFSGWHDKQQHLQATSQLEILVKRE
jgi:hypothetical protein